MRQHLPRSSSGIRMAVVLACISAVLVTLLLKPVLTGGPFADDWPSHTGDPHEVLQKAFVEARPFPLYRPLQSIAIAASEIWTGGTLLLHLLQIGIHAGLVGICVLWMGMHFTGGRAAILAAAFLTFSQLNAPALGGNDTFSLVLGTMAGTLSIFLTLRFRKSPSSTIYWAAIASLAVALLAKESSLGYVPVVCALLVLDGSRAPLAPSRIARIAPPVLLALAYLGWRHSLGAAGLSFEEESTFHLGTNLIANFVQIAFAATVPVCTTDVFTWLHTREWLKVLIALAGALAVAGVSGYGIRSLVGTRGLAALVLIAAAVVSPVILMWHISELYAYALLPFLAIGFGAGVSALLRGSAIRRAVVSLFAALVLLGNALALDFDARSMALNGKRAAPLMRALVAEAKSLPEGSRMVLVNPVLDLPEYSVFRMRNFRLTPAPDVARRSGRSDLRIEVVDTWNGGDETEHETAVFTLTKDVSLTRWK